MGVIVAFSHFVAPSLIMAFTHGLNSTVRRPMLATIDLGAMTHGKVRAVVLASGGPASAKNDPKNVKVIRK